MHFVRCKRILCLTTQCVLWLVVHTETHHSVGYGERPMATRTKQQNTAKSDKAGYETSPHWAAAKQDAEHRAALRASFSLDVSDDWLDDLEA
jgi:hypothetical protein